MIKLSQLPPQLTDAEVRSLYNDYRSTRCLALRERLIEGLLRRVFVWTYKFYNREEYFLEASLTLVQVVDSSLTKDVKDIVPFIRAAVNNKVHHLMRGEGNAVNTVGIEATILEAKQANQDESIPAILNDYVNKHNIDPLDAKILDLKMKGHSLREIGDEIGFVPSSVFKRLEKLKGTLHAYLLP